MEAARDRDAAQDRGEAAADPEGSADGGSSSGHDEAVTKPVTRERAAGKAGKAAQEKPEPYAYVALTDLYLPGDGAGVMPVPAFRAGAQVLPQDVERHGWADLVRRADEPAPDDKGKE